MKKPRICRNCGEDYFNTGVEHVTDDKQVWRFCSPLCLVKYMEALLADM